MNHLEELVEEWLSLCGYSPRASSSQQAEILQAAVAGIPRVAKAIAAIPAEHRGSACGAAERCYMQTAKDLGGADKFAQKWASAVMLRLRAEVEQQVSANRKVLKALEEELVRTESADAEEFRRIRQRRQGIGAVNMATRELHFSIRAGAVPMFGFAPFPSNATDEFRAIGPATSRRSKDIVAVESNAIDDGFMPPTIPRGQKEAANKGGLTRNQ